MNTYYLKKFRKWARECVKIYANEKIVDRYDVWVGSDWRKLGLNLEEAKEVLKERRRYLILKWCWIRRIKKLNKQLAKL